MHPESNVNGRRVPRATIKMAKTLIINWLANRGFIGVGVGIGMLQRLFAQSLIPISGWTPTRFHDTCYMPDHLPEYGFDDFRGQQIVIVFRAKGSAQLLGRRFYISRIPVHGFHFRSRSPGYPDRTGNIIFW